MKFTYIYKHTVCCIFYRVHSPYIQYRTKKRSATSCDMRHFAFRLFKCSKKNLILSDCVTLDIELSGQREFKFSVIERIVRASSLLNIKRILCANSAVFLVHVRTCIPESSKKSQSFFYFYIFVSVDISLRPQLAPRWTPTNIPRSNLWFPLPNSHSGHHKINISWYLLHLRQQRPLSTNYIPVCSFGHKPLDLALDGSTGYMYFKTSLFVATTSSLISFSLLRPVAV